MFNKSFISPEKQKLIVYILLAVSTFAVYWQVYHFNFVNIDDPVYVVDNSHIKSGINCASIRWAFTTTYAEFWHPLTWLSLMIDYQLYGLKAGGYHLTNLILHIMSSLLLFWLFCRMTGAVWKSAFVAGLFALHPLHVEAVAYVAERKDVLCAFFWMLTLCLYVLYSEKETFGRYLLVLCSFILALMSKPMVITLPVVMILLDYWPLGRLNLNRIESHPAKSPHQQGLKRLLWEKIPFFILALVFSVITLHAHNKMLVRYFHFPLELRIDNAFISFIAYLKKTFLPYDLSVYYTFYGQIPVIQILIAVIIILIISAVVMITAKKLPFLFIGWLWYAITILPVIGIIQFNSKSMADRYMYLPSIGIYIMMAWGVPFLLRSERAKKYFLWPAATVLLLVLSFMTWKQTSYWKGSIDLLTHALRISQDAYVIPDCLGLALMSEGKPREAIDGFNQAIIINPDYANAYNNRGTAYSAIGQKERAIEDYGQAIRLRPDYAEAFYNRGTTFFELKQYQRAVGDYDQAIRINSDYIPAYYNRGIAYSQLGLYEMAIKDYSRIIELKPDFADAYNNRGAVFFNQGSTEKGCIDAKIACRLGSCRIWEVARNKGLCR